MLDGMIEHNVNLPRGWKLKEVSGMVTYGRLSTLYHNCTLTHKHIPSDWGIRCKWWEFWDFDVVDGRATGRGSPDVLKRLLLLEISNSSYYTAESWFPDHAFYSVFVRTV